MKSGVSNSLKFKRLKKLLGLRDYAVTGILEMLWGLAVDQARMGDVGRYSDDEIATALDWDGDATQLVEAIVEAGWLDPHNTARLVVHDWADHAPQFVIRSIAKILSLPKGAVVQTEWRKHWFGGASTEVCLDVSSQQLDASSEKSLHNDPCARGSIPFNSIPPPPGPVTAGSAADPEWVTVVAALHVEGVGRKQSAVNSARQAGCAPGDLIGLIEHFRSNKPAWEPGALHDRILEMRPGEDPSTGWPPPSEASRAIERNGEREAVAAKAAAERAEGKRRVENDRQRIARMEADHGAAVNAMDRAAMEAVLDRKISNWRKLYVLKDSGKHMKGAVRYELLCHQESMAAKSP